MELELRRRCLGVREVRAENFVPVPIMLAQYVPKIMLPSLVLLGSHILRDGIGMIEFSSQLRFYSLLVGFKKGR